MSRLKRLVSDENYPYYVETLHTVCPDLVGTKIYGEHRSMVGAGSKRHWGFHSLEGYELFKAHAAQGKFTRLDEMGNLRPRPES